MIALSASRQPDGPPFAPLGPFLVRQARPGRLASCGLLLFLAFAGAVAAQAVKVASAERSHDMIITFTNPVLVEGVAERGIFAAGAEVVISGQVYGDVAVIGGKLVLHPKAVVSGSVVLVGSEQVREPGSQIHGKIFVAPFFGEDTRQFLANPAAYLFTQRYDPGSIALRFFFSLFWFVLSVLVIKFMPERVSLASHRMKKDPLLMAGVGVVGATGLFTFFLLFIAMCLFLIGIPLLFLLMVFFLGALLFGMTTVFYTTGEALCRLLRIQRPAPTTALVLAIGAWTVAKFVPVLSLIVSAAAVLFSLGATLSTRFGSGRPWFASRNVHRHHPSSTGETS